MKTIQTNVYTFDELNDKAKEKAREWWHNCSEGDNSFSEYVIEDAQTCFGLCGFDIDKVYWSGFWSQGDGACFVGSWRADRVQPGKLKEHAPQDEELHRIAAEIERIAAAFPNASFSVKHSGHYYHEGCTDFEVSMVNEDECNEHGEWKDMDLLARETEALIEASRDAMRWIYRQLENAYNWENADEQVDEILRANEYTFTEDGKRFG